MSAENNMHVALPLKYRPMTFDDVVGQEHVVRTLRHAIEAGRIANAYLFVGPRGIGKTTLSRIFAKALNCMSPNGAEPCGKCVNCLEIAAGRSLDVIELDAASNNKVDDVKPIIEAVEFKPASSRFRIFIIDECHMLTNAAWNALLKTLEEPPSHVRFVFATTEGDKVLATIVSRCQRFDLRRIQTNDIVSRLAYICKKENIEAHSDALLAIARGAEGGMRDALSSLDQLISFTGEKITEEDALGVFGLVSRSALENLAGAIIGGDIATILSSIEMFDAAGKNMRRIAGELLLHFRNLVVVQALGGGAKSLEATGEQIETLLKQSKQVDSGRVFRICDQLSEMEDRLRHALSVRTLIEMTLIRACRIASTATIDELLKVVRSLKSGDMKPLEEIKISSLPAYSAAGQSSKSVEPAASKLVEAVDAGDAPESVKRDDSARPVMAMASPVSPERHEQILNDEKINSILAAIPGAIISDIRRS